MIGMAYSLQHGWLCCGGDFLARMADVGIKAIHCPQSYQLPSWWTLLFDTGLPIAKHRRNDCSNGSALKQGATVIVIASGGVLAGLCELHENCHLIPSIGGQPPRTAFGHLFSRQLALMEHLGLIPQQ